MLINLKITTEYYSDLFSYIATTLKLGIIKSPIEDIIKNIKDCPF